MTMPENQGHEPHAAGAVRGALLIVVLGVALGIAYNAMGLASRPRHGIVWVKSEPKLESLEALQTPAPAQPAPDAGATSAPVTPVQAGTPDVAQAATVSHTTTPVKVASPPAREKKTDAPPPAATSAPASTGKAASATAATTTKPPGTLKPPGSAAGTQTAAAPATPPPPANAAPSGAIETKSSATMTAAADVPAIPDVAGPLKVEIGTVKKLYDANAALVVDAREADEYNDGHISGALSLPYNDAMAEPDKVKKLDPAGRPIVVYCSGGACELSIDLAKLMIENGKRRVLVYEGGFPEWQSAGYAVAKGPNP